MDIALELADCSKCDSVSGRGGQCSEILRERAETVSTRLTIKETRSASFKVQATSAVDGSVGLCFLHLWQVHEKELKASQKERQAICGR